MVREKKSKHECLIKATVATFCSENVHNRPAAFIDHVPTCLILLKKTKQKHVDPSLEWIVLCTLFQS